MTDGYDFAWNSTILPLSSVQTLSTADPTTNTILRFYTNILELNLGAAFAADAANCGFLHANMDYVKDGYMVAQSIAYPVASTLQTTDYKFPLLTVYRTKRNFLQHSSLRVMIESLYDVCFILPPLSPIQLNKLYKYLSNVSDVLVTRSWQGFDPNYNGGELVWKTANIAYAMLDGDEYGSFLGQDGKTEFPSIKFSLRAIEQFQYVNSNYESLDNVYIETDLYDGYNLTNPVFNIADGYANPNLSISSINIASGSVNGGTLVVIQGTGFNNVQSSPSKSSYDVTFNGAPVRNLFVKSNTVIITCTGPGQLGIGDVVIMDTLKNISSLINAWTYL